MINKIIVHIDTPVRHSNFAYDALMYKKLLGASDTYDFHTTGLHFITQKKLGDVDAIVLRWEATEQFKDVYITKKQGNPSKQCDVFAVVGSKGTYHRVTERLVRRAHSLEKMFLAGEFNEILEEIA